MKTPLSILLPAVLLVVAGCGERGKATADLPADVAAVIRLVDLEHASMTPVKEALLSGGGAVVGSVLATQLSAAAPPPVPHEQPAPDIGLVDALLDGVLVLPGHDPVELAPDPTWAEAGSGDANWIFQYHTLRWSMPLLHAWRETRDERYLDRFLALLADYGRDVVDADPERVHPLAWNDMGAALRAENWLAARRILLAEGRLDPALHLDLLQWLARHGEMLAHRVKYKADSNHGTFQSRALIALGLSLPELKASSEWFELGKGRVDRQVLDMVSEEGVYLERTPQYHFMMMNVFQSVRVLMQGAGCDLPAEASRRIGLLGSVGAHLVKPDGSLPMIGDSPARVSLKSQARGEPELLFAITNGKEGRRPDGVIASYPEDGYVFLRSGWGETRDFADESFIYFDIGASGGGHSHADALNVLFSSWGEDLLVDSGLFTYQGGEDRSYFVGPRAHNVVLPDPVPDDWKGSRDSELLHQGENEGIVSYAAVTKMPDGTEWTRHVIWIRPDDVLILDRFDKDNPDGGRLQRFQLHPDAAATLKGAVVSVVHGRAHMEVRPVGVAPVVHAPDSPGAGWYSPAYGKRERTTVVTIARDGGQGPFAVLFHAHDGSDVLNRVSLERRPREELLQFLIETQSGRERVFVWLDDGRVQRVPAR